MMDQFPTQRHCLLGTTSRSSYPEIGKNLRQKGHILDTLSRGYESLNGNLRLVLLNRGSKQLSDA
jgi:hypothetical protein